MIFWNLNFIELKKQPNKSDIEWEFLETWQMKHSIMWKSIRVIFTQNFNFEWILNENLCYGIKFCIMIYMICRSSKSVGMLTVIFFPKKVWIHNSLQNWNYHSFYNKQRWEIWNYPFSGKNSHLPRENSKYCK